MTKGFNAAVKQLTAKIHTVHPGLVLPVIGFGAWPTTAAVLVLTEPGKPGPGDQAVAPADTTTGSTAAGGTPAGTNTQRMTPRQVAEAQKLAREWKREWCDARTPPMNPAAARLPLKRLGGRDVQPCRAADPQLFGGGLPETPT
jgi:hypothetical protein